MASVAELPGNSDLAQDFVPKHWSEKLPDDALDHIPGEAGWPIVGNTFRMLADPHLSLIHI